MLSSRRTSVALALAIVALAAVWAAVGIAPDDGVKFAGTAPIQSSEVAWAADERFVVGAADDVFVGRVLRVQDDLTTSPTSSLPQPQSQFAVEVQRNIKGKINGTVTVNQGGGFVEYSADRDYPEADVQKGDRVRQLGVVNEVPLLEPGREYLFVTTYDNKNGWHEFVSPGLARLEVEDRAQREALVENFEEAEREQVDPFGFAGTSGLEPAP